MTNEEFLKSITLEGEMWKDVAGYEGCYMVSNFGRVMSLGREVPNSDKSNRIIRPSTGLDSHTRPYYRFTWTKKGEGSSCLKLDG